MIFLSGIILGITVVAYLVIHLQFPGVPRRKIAMAIGAAGLLISGGLLVMVDKAARTMLPDARLLAPGEKVSDVKLPP